MPTLHVSRAFMAVAPLALGMGAATLALTLPGERSSQLSVLLAFLLIVAWEFVAIGLFMLARGRARWFGLLSTLTGFGLFVLSWRFSEVPLAYTLGLLFGLAFWGPFLHLVLAFPAGQVPERGLRWLIGSTYAAVVLVHPLRFLFWEDPYRPTCDPCPRNLALVQPDQELAEAVGALTMTAGMVAFLAFIGYFAYRARSGRRLQRLLQTPIAATMGGALVLAFLTGVMELGGDAELTQDFNIAFLAVFAGVPIALFVGLLRSRTYRAEAISGLVERLGGPPGPDALRDALAQALEDPSVEVAYWVADKGHYVDDRGETVDLSPANEAAGRARTLIEDAGSPLAVIAHDARLDDEPGLVSSTGAAVRVALRIGQLVREQEAQARAGERIAHELELARVIQRRFLPSELPALQGWLFRAHYSPAREVGGDFYDVLALPEGRVGLLMADVTGKGVPAALVMAAARSVLRGAAQRLVEPRAVLEEANDRLCPDMPPKMFVTCLYLVLDPVTGRLRFANAGHDLPIAKTATGVAELRARGMPLGLMTSMTYDEGDAILSVGDALLLHTDGVTEAHAASGEMFGLPRLKTLVARTSRHSELITRICGELNAFSGADTEQEDDITMLTLERSGDESDPTDTTRTDDGDALLADFELASEVGKERVAIDRVTDAVTPFGLSGPRLEGLRTAVGEATINAIEHGNRFRPDTPVTVRVRAGRGRVRVQVTDHGGTIAPPAELPNLEAKIAGRELPRGWGRFLIENMVDETNETANGELHTVELTIRIGPSDQAR